MLIGICGGVCTGKNSIANYLVKEHCFRRVAVDSSSGAWPKPSVADDDVFPDLAALLEHVTKRWDRNWVIANITDEKALDILSIKPFFMLISVDAPVTLRWQRYKARCVAHEQKPPALEEFVLDSDRNLYDRTRGLAHLAGHAQLRLLNSFTSHEDFVSSLHALRLTDEQRLRPNWDEYFMQLADLAAMRSNCMKRRVGCVLVREKRVISTGYNGTPRNVKNCNKGGCARCNSGQARGAALATCLCIHAEENALLEAGRERIREGATLYCNTCPCLTCTVKIAQVGISEVVFSHDYSMDGQAAAVLKEAGVQLRQYSPLRQGLVDLSSLSSQEAGLLVT